MDSEPATSTLDAQARFLRLFLSAEKELFRYIAALVPNVADADEIVQQTALFLWTKFEQYDPQQPFTPWACRFAINVVKQWAARRQRWQSLLEYDLPEILSKRRDELREAFDSRLQHLEACLAKLPAEQRSIVESYYFRKTSVETIAADSQRSVDAVYKSLQRIRSLLRQCIEMAVKKGESHDDLPLS